MFSRRGVRHEDWVATRRARGRRGAQGVNGQRKGSSGGEEAWTGRELRLDRGWSKLASRANEAWTTAGPSLHRRRTKLRPRLVQACIGGERSFDHGWSRVTAVVGMPS